MRFLIDTHAHTIASGHAYCTISEMAHSAHEKGLKLLCITDHAPKMPGSCHEIYFRNFKAIDRYINGVEIFMGSELNILNFDGEVDIPENVLSKFDIAIASFHTVCIKPGTVEENTRAFLNVMNNPYVNIVGHPEDGKVPVDFEPIVKKAKETDTLIELNNSSLSPTSSRINTWDNARKLLKICKKYQTFVAIGSDAHFSTYVGENKFALQVVREVDFPIDLIINTNIDKFKDFISKKRKNAI